MARCLFSEEKRKKARTRRDLQKDWSSGVKKKRKQCFGQEASRESVIRERRMQRRGLTGGSSDVERGGGGKNNNDENEWKNISKRSGRKSQRRMLLALRVSNLLILAFE